MSDATEIDERAPAPVRTAGGAAPSRRVSAGSRAARAAAVPPRVLSKALVFSALAIALVTVGLLYGAGGWQYYRTPVALRPYAPGHAVLRPSGSIGHVLGLVGLGMMAVPVLYSIRKKWRRLSRLGSMKVWLEVHIFCGIVGPVVVTFHSAFKFNGLISVAYWSMMAVMLSGFVGRYLYVRMPRSIRGVELTYEEALARAGEIHAALEDTGVRADLVARLEAAAGATRGRFLQLRRLRRDLAREGVPPASILEAVRLAEARAVLLRRLAHLQRTRRLFAMWHVFHQPLVYVSFGIVLVHVGLALYLGYGLFTRR